MTRYGWRFWTIDRDRDGPVLNSSIAPRGADPTAGEHVDGSTITATCRHGCDAIPGADCVCGMAYFTDRATLHSIGFNRLLANAVGRQQHLRKTSPLLAAGIPDPAIRNVLPIAIGLVEPFGTVAADPMMLGCEQSRRATSVRILHLVIEPVNRDQARRLAERYGVPVSTCGVYNRAALDKIAADPTTRIPGIPTNPRKAQRRKARR